MWKFSIFLWALFLALLLFGWKMLLLILFLSILCGIGDYQYQENLKKKKYEKMAQENKLSAAKRLKKRNAQIHAILASVAASKQAELKEKSDEIGDKLANLEAEIDKLSHEIKGASDTHLPLDTVEAQRAEQIERLEQKLSELKAIAMGRM